MFNKDLTQQINDFLQKIKDREQKIKSQIIELGGRSADIKNSISTLTSDQVECEINDDLKGSDQCSKRVRELRFSLEETDSRIKAYKEQLAHGPILKKEFSKIKSAALKAERARVEKEKSLQAEKSAVESQIKQLEQRLKQIGVEIAQTNFITEISELKSVIRYFEPRFSQLPHYLEKDFFSVWLNEGNVERFFEKHKRADAPTIIEGNV